MVRKFLASAAAGGIAVAQAQEHYYNIKWYGDADNTCSSPQVNTSSGSGQVPREDFFQSTMTGQCVKYTINGYATTAGYMSVTCLTPGSRTGVAQLKYWKTSTTCQGTPDGDTSIALDQDYAPETNWYEGGLSSCAPNFKEAHTAGVFDNVCTTDPGEDCQHNGADENAAIKAAWNRKVKIEISGCAKFTGLDGLANAAAAVGLALLIIFVICPCCIALIVLYLLWSCCCRKKQQTQIVVVQQAA